MKKLSKLIMTAILCLSIALTAITPAFAAVAKVKKLKATVTYNTVTLQWQKASGVSGYEVQQASGKKWKTIAKTRKTTLKIKKLKSATTYKFRVRAFKKSGKKTVYGNASTISAKTLCAAPKNLKAAVLSPTTAKLTWTKTAGASRYRIQKWNGKKWVFLTSTPSTSAVVSGLVPSVGAKFRVCALSQSGKKVVAGAYSASVTVKTSLATPSALKITGSTATSVTLTWSKVDGAADYVIYQDGNLVRVSKTNSVTIDKGILPGTVYKFNVRARVNSAGKYYLSAFSSSISTKTAPAAVSGFSAAAATASSVVLTWNAETSADSYWIYTVKNGKDTKTATVSGAATEYTVFNLEESTEYSFRIRAVCEFNGKTLLGPLSDIKSAKTSVSGVKGLTVNSVTATSAELSWKVLNSAEAYTLEQSTDKNKWTKAADISSSSAVNDKISYTVNGLNEGSVTYFRVSSKVSGSDETAYSDIVTVKTTPGKVTGLKALVSADSKSVAVTWTAIPSADGYIVSFDGKTTEVSKNSATLTLSSVYTRANTKYSYSVTAFTKFGAKKLTGAQSDPCVFKTPIGNITNLRTTERTSIDGEKINIYYSLIWDSIPNAEYIVESKNTAVSANWQQIEKSSINKVDVSSSISDIKATKKTDYVTTLSWKAVPGASKYIIKSANSAGSSNLSEIASTTSTSIDLNLAPSTKVNLVVLAVASAVSYRVKAVDTEKMNPDSGYKEYSATNSVVASGSITYTTPAASSFDGSTESQRAYTLKLIQAINNTKDEKTPVTASANTKLEANVKSFAISGFVDITGILKREADKALEELKKEMNENKSRTLNFNNGIAVYTGKDSNGNDVTYSQRLNSFIIPTPEKTYENRYAYLYNQNDLNSFKKGISNVKASESGGKTTVSLTINQEGSNAVYHPGFVESITDNLGGIAGDGATCTATVGATTVVGVINSNGTLDSLKVVSPFTIKLEVPIEEGSSIKIQMTLSGSSNYNYTFTR